MLSKDDVIAKDRLLKEFMGRGPRRTEDVERFMKEIGYIVPSYSSGGPDEYDYSSGHLAYTSVEIDQIEGAETAAEVEAEDSHG